MNTVREPAVYGGLMNRTPDEKQLLVGLDEYTAHADALAEPLPDELAPYRAPDGDALHDAQPEEQSGE